MEAVTLFRHGHYQDALARCQDHLASQPDDAEVWFLQAHCCLALGDLDNAHDSLLEATHLAPQRGEIWHDLGCCNLELDERAEGIRCLAQACQLEPDNPNFRQSLNRALRGARDLVLIVDGSAQASPYWAEVVSYVRLLLDTLTGGDRLALVVFHDDLEGYQQGIFCAADQAQAAVAWLHGVRPRGGADCTILVERIATMHGEPGRDLRVIMLLAGPVRCGLSGSIVVPPLDVLGIRHEETGPLAALAHRSGGAVKRWEPGGPVDEEILFGFI